MADLGRTAAERLLNEGVRAGHDLQDPCKPAFASAFVDELAAGLEHPQGWMRDVLDGTGRIARHLNVAPEHGLVELIQNADDVGAKTVRFAFVPGRRREILVVHDGDRVLAPHVLGMTLALVSTKPDDPDATGKFGIGLSTVVRLATRFEVHCAPYHFTVEDQRLTRSKARASTSLLYDAARPDTLLALRLRDDFPDEALGQWFEQFSADALLFMRNVRQLELRKPDGSLIATKRLDRRRTRRVKLRLGDRTWNAEELELRDPATKATWWRLQTTVAPPANLERTDKATPRSAPFAVAHCSRPEKGRLFAGLPLAVGGRFPFSLNALFDTDASRTDLLKNQWNEWVLDELKELASAGANHRLRTDPATGWCAVPLQNEATGIPHQWLSDKANALVLAVQEDVRTAAELPHGSGGTALSDFSAEVAALEPLLDDQTLANLSQGPGLERGARDTDGRWRSVLDELAVTRWVGPSDALLLFDDPAFDRPGPWCVELIAAALGERLGDALVGAQCLRLDSGARVSPRAARKSSLLLGPPGADTEPLSAHLGLARSLDTAFFVDEAPAERVRGWLEHEAQVRTSPRPSDTLRALAGGALDEPVELDDEGLLLLQDALRSVSPASVASIGADLGMRVLVDGRVYRSGRWRDVKVRPAEAYLPDTVDTGRETWAKAAGITPGILWVHRRYGEALRRTARRQDGGTPRRGQRSASPVRSGPLSLFRDLGAETAPRLNPRPQTLKRYDATATRVPRSQLTQLQREALPHGKKFDGLQGDHLSPDLEAVVGNIAKAKVAAGQTRARALLTALNRAWPRLYAGHETCQAVHAYYELRALAELPATWTARAAGTPWMTNELGRRRTPAELAVRTPATEAIFGDSARTYAFGLTVRDAESPAVRGLLFRSEPHASDVLTQLEALRSDELKGKNADLSWVASCYTALAEVAPPPDRRGYVDDVPVSAVKKQFRKRERGATGLVRTSAGWKAPSEVFVGRAIFKHRRAFAEFEAPKLWRLLEMAEPTVSECAHVVAEVSSSGALSDEDRAIPIETFRYLLRLLNESESQQLRLGKLPLWSGSQWLTRRPVFAVHDSALQKALRGRLDVWEPPVRLRELEALLPSLKVTLLPEESFELLGAFSSGALAAGSSLQGTFHEAVRHLTAWLAVNDAELHDQLVTHPELASARVAVNRGLVVRIPVPDRRTVEVPRRAHLLRVDGSILVAFAARDLVEDGDAVGPLLGELLGVDARAELVLSSGWAHAVSRTLNKREVEGVELAEPMPAEPQPDSGRRSKRTSVAPKRTSEPDVVSDEPAQLPQPTSSNDLPPRRLKPLSDIDVTVTHVSGPDGAASAARTGNDRAPDEPKLRKPRTGPNDRTGGDREHTGQPTWSQQQRETRGMEVLQREMKRLDGRIVRDIRTQDGVGADGIDDQGRYYELKAHAGDMPDDVGLQPSEFLRAQEQQQRFILAVVSGLEEGYDTQLLWVEDPLGALHWEPEADIKVYGLKALNRQQPAE